MEKMNTCASVIYFFKKRFLWLFGNNYIIQLNVSEGRRQIKNVSYVESFIQGFRRGTVCCWGRNVEPR